MPTANLDSYHQNINLVKIVTQSLRHHSINNEYADTHIGSLTMSECVGLFDNNLL